MATTPYPFVASTVLTALQLNSTFNIPTTTKTASHTLLAADAGTRVYMNSASATTITVNTSIFSASDVVEILNIGAGVCTITAGTCTVSSTGTLALVQNAGGRLVFTSAGVAVFLADGVAAGAGTKIGQVVTTLLTTTFTTTSTSFIDITGLTVSITPTLITSKILVLSSVSGCNNVGVASGGFRLARGGTGIFQGDTAGNRISGEQVEPPAADRMVTVGLSVLDSPATTSATTYSVQAINGSAATFYVNRSATDGNSVSYFRGASSITVMEVIV